MKAIHFCCVLFLFVLGSYIFSEADAIQGQGIPHRQTLSDKVCGAWLCEELSMISDPMKDYFFPDTEPTVIQQQIPPGVHSPSQCDGSAMPKNAQELSKWYSNCVKIKFIQSEGNSELIKEAISKFEDFQIYVQQIGLEEQLSEEIQNGNSWIIISVNDMYAINNNECLETGDYSYAAKALEWFGYAWLRGLATEENGLTMNKMEDSLCIKIIFEKLDIPSVLEKNKESLISIKAGYQIGDNQIQYDPPLKFYYSFSGKLEEEYAQNGEFKKTITAITDYPVTGFVQAEFPPLSIDESKSINIPVSASESSDPYTVWTVDGSVSDYIDNPWMPGVKDITKFTLSFARHHDQLYDTPYVTLPDDMTPNYSEAVFLEFPVIGSNSLIIEDPSKFTKITTDDETGIHTPFAGPPHPDHTLHKEYHLKTVDTFSAGSAQMTARVSAFHFMTEGKETSPDITVTISILNHIPVTTISVGSGLDKETHCDPIKCEIIKDREEETVFSTTTTESIHMGVEGKLLNNYESSYDNGDGIFTTCKSIGSPGIYFDDNIEYLNELTPHSKEILNKLLTKSGERNLKVIGIFAGPDGTTNAKWYNYVLVSDTTLCNYEKFQSALNEMKNNGDFSLVKLPNDYWPNYWSDLGGTPLFGSYFLEIPHKEMPVGDSISNTDSNYTFDDKLNVLKKQAFDQLQSSDTDLKTISAISSFLSFQKVSDMTPVADKFTYSLDSTWPVIEKSIWRNNNVCINNPTPQNVNQVLLWMRYGDDLGFSKISYDDSRLCPLLKNILGEIQTPTPSPTPSPTPNVLADKKISLPKYKETKSIPIQGELPEYERGIPVEIVITKPDGTKESMFVVAKKTGDYDSQFQIAHDSKVGNYQFEIKYNSKTVDSFSVKVTSEQVPEWIKNNAKWWADGQLEDKTFTQGIEFLIKERIINISNLSQESSEITKERVPIWVKNNAKWWADDMITEDDFIKGIKYLVENKIIRTN